jgi:hypothetical protein
MSAASVLTDVLRWFETMMTEAGDHSKWHFYRLQHFFNDILYRDAVEHGFDGFDKATPLHASLVLGSSHDNSMRIDFARCEGDQ